MLLTATTLVDLEGARGDNREWWSGGQYLCEGFTRAFDVGASMSPEGDSSVSVKEEIAYLRKCVWFEDSPHVRHQFMWDRQECGTANPRRGYA